LWYWEPGDPSSLADTIARFARASSTERTNRIQDAQRRMHQFSWERERETLKAIYEEFLATA
jgi:glycosyltransferase involved in cell wall biosynthesis